MSRILYEVAGQTIFPVVESGQVARYVRIFWDGKTKESMEQIEVKQPPIETQKLAKFFVERFRAWFR